MHDDTSASDDGGRALRRRSLGRRAWCDESLPPNLIDTIVRGNPGELLYSSTPLQVKDRCVVAKCAWIGGSLLIKRHTWGGVWRTTRMAFRESAAKRCARLGTHLHRQGIRTPCPKAYVDFHLGPWTYQSFLFTDYVEGESLYRYIRFGSQTEDELRHIAGQVADIWQKLVELGVSHDDMKPENFVIDRNRDVWLIDLERVRLTGNPRRQHQRQVFDVQNFLHVRGWHHRAEARNIFANAFLQTRFGDWLRRTVSDRADCFGSQGEAQVDADLSVLVLCPENASLPQLRHAAESVRDIADELVLVTAAESGNATVLKRVNLVESSNSSAPDQTNEATTRTAPLVARYPWVLVLKQNESVTPFLAKELQQWIANPQAKKATRIPIEEQYFARTVRFGERQIPVRLFNQTECSFELSASDVRVFVDGGHSGRLCGTIHACKCATIGEFIGRLNEESTIAAITRLAAGERPRLLRTALRAIGQFSATLIHPRGIGNGWPSLQVAALEAVFSWVEEIKLYQLAGEFHPRALDEQLREQAAPIDSEFATSSNAATAHRSAKAA
ncbi:MAG TPA: lipopolysaccharide kinase InaA family protein [Lacipirellulaceae bacterium]|nr:lipopolysaccharide kinase InaA family protein [Lacipirellulaceae bacterium]